MTPILFVKYDECYFVVHEIDKEHGLVRVRNIGDFRRHHTAFSLKGLESESGEPTYYVCHKCCGWREFIGYRPVESKVGFLNGPSGSTFQDWHSTYLFWNVEKDTWI